MQLKATRLRLQNQNGTEERCDGTLRSGNTGVWHWCSCVKRMALASNLACAPSIALGGDVSVPVESDWYCHVVTSGQVVGEN